jgi:aryl carrier-like protein
MNTRLIVIEAMEQIAREQNKTLRALTDDMALLETGLDSLCFAILVARLEDKVGYDPFTMSDDVEFPVTLGEFIGVYENARLAA